MESRRSYCRICAAYCGIVADVDQGRLVEVRGDRDHALSRGYSCVKGRRIPALVNHPDRLRQSLRRNAAGSFEPVDGDRAFDEIAVKLSELTERHGPRSIATYTGTGCWGHIAMVEVIKAWHAGIGSVMRCSSASIEHDYDPISGCARQSAIPIRMRRALKHA